MIAKAGASTSPTERLHRQGGIVIAGNASTSPRLDRVIDKALTCDDSIANTFKSLGGTTGGDVYMK